MALMDLQANTVLAITATGDASHRVDRLMVLQVVTASHAECLPHHLVSLTRLVDHLECSLDLLDLR